MTSGSEPGSWSILVAKILDRQGKAIGAALERMECDEVDEVRAGKAFVSELRSADLASMCLRFLANPIIEGDSFTLEEDVGVRCGGRRLSGRQLRSRRQTTFLELRCGLRRRRRWEASDSCSRPTEPSSTWQWPLSERFGEPLGHERWICEMVNAELRWA